jgi:hypothetical protein
MRSLVERIESQGANSGELGPNKFNVGDLVKLGKSKPRIVRHIANRSVSLQSAVKMPSLGKLPSERPGYTELFWNEKRNEYWLQDGSGKTTGRFSPEEVTVTKSN